MQRVSNRTKFSMLMWKNWLLQIHHPVRTLFECLMAPVICCVYIVLRVVIQQRFMDAVYYPEFNPTTSEGLTSYEFAYSPDNSPAVTTLMAVVAEKAQKFPNEDMLEKYLNSLPGSQRVGIVFPASYMGMAELPDEVEYTLRLPAEMQDWMTDRVYVRNWGVGPRGYPSKMPPSPNYQEQFLALQHTVSVAIMKQLGTVKIPEALTMQRFPHLPVQRDRMQTLVENTLAAVLATALTINVFALIHAATMERQRGLHEMLRIAGANAWLQWFAWVCKSLVLIGGVFVVLIAQLQIGTWYPRGTPSIMHSCNCMLLLVFCLLYCIAFVTYCLAVSACFNNANLAAMIGCILFLAFLLPYAICEYSTIQANNFGRLSVCLMFNSAWAYGFQLMAQYSKAGVGLHYKNVFTPITPESVLSFGVLCCMLMICTLLHVAVAFYMEVTFDQLRFFPRALCRLCRNRGSKLKAVKSSIVFLNPSRYQVLIDSPSKTIGVDIRGLSKNYSNSQTEVKYLHLRLYEGQVTMIVGHYHSGKTAFLQMLSGSVKPTYGQATLAGFDLRTQLDAVRLQLGICPQNNAVYDELTVGEQLSLFGRLRGLDYGQIEQQIKNFLGILQLDAEECTKMRALPVEKQRLLKVALAFCGAPKVVLLDEPTRGLGPIERRLIWDLFTAQLEGKTILMTTMDMFEANLVGNRIAILSNGALVACGTSEFLKMQYGYGYRLKMDVQRECDEVAVTDLLHRHIPSAELELESLAPTKLVYKFHWRVTQNLPALFQELDANLKILAVDEYFFCLTPLQDIYTNACCEGLIRIEPEGDASDFVEHSHLLFTFLKGLHAFVMKRFLVAARTWHILLIQILTLVVILVLAFHPIFKTLFDNPPKMVIAHEVYNDPQVLLSGSGEYLSGANQHLNDENVPYEKVGDIEAALLDKMGKDRHTVFIKYIVAAELNGDGIKLWFNGEPYHASALALNFAHNAILKTFNKKFAIRVRNHPLPYAISGQLANLELNAALPSSIARDLSIGMVFMLALAVFFYGKERHSFRRHMEHVTNTGTGIFWLQSLLWDMLIYAIIVSSLIGVMYLIGLSIVKSQNYVTLVIIFVCYGYALFAIIYLFSYFFKSTMKCYVTIVIYCVTGTLLYIAMSTYTEQGNKDNADLLRTIGQCFPSFNFVLGFVRIYNYNLQGVLCTRAVAACLETGVFSNDECSDQISRQASDCQAGNAERGWLPDDQGPYLRASLIHGTLALLLVIIIDCTRLPRFHRSKPTACDVEPDNDVKTEELVVTYMTTDEKFSFALVLKQATCVLRERVVVSGLYIYVRKLVSFALFGLPASGRSAMIRMVTGEMPMSAGEIYVNGFHLRQKFTDISLQIGYCPQVDAFNEYLTVRETIIFYALSRGYTYSNLWGMVAEVAHCLDLQVSDLSTRVGQASMGLRRKLAIVVALIGAPSVVFLDEPTYGMDPASRQIAWDFLSAYSENGRSLILVSQSMRECKALAQKIAVLVRGRISSIGMLRTLQNKSQHEVLLTIRVVEEDAITRVFTMQKVQEFIDKLLPDAMLQEWHQAYLVWHLCEMQKTWAEVYSALEKHREDLKIEDYTMGLMSLEEVYVKVIHDVNVEFTEALKPDE